MLAAEWNPAKGTQDSVGSAKPHVWFTLMSFILKNVDSKEEQTEATSFLHLHEKGRTRLFSTQHCKPTEHLISQLFRHFLVQQQTCTPSITTMKVTTDAI